MDNEKGHNRPGHDGLFKLFLREPDTARDFLAVHLPADIRAQVRLDTLKLEPGSFVDQKLRELHSDVLYSVETAEGHAGYIYCLVEHQSTADRMMAWRMMRYSMAVMDAHLKKGNDTLPVVVPLLFYQGTVRPYPYSTDWMDTGAGAGSLLPTVAPGGCQRHGGQRSAVSPTHGITGAGSAGYPTPRCRITVARRGTADPAGR